jgi:hypothetical protein
MTRRSRIRLFVKWGGAVVCVLSIALWWVTLYWTMHLNTTSLSIRISEGGISVFGTGWYLQHERADEATVVIERCNEAPRLWLPYAHGPFYMRGRLITQWIVIIPMWLLFLIGFVPFVWLARRDWRIPPGCCRECGYNLTGNVSGTCPECGTPTSEGQHDVSGRSPGDGLAACPAKASKTGIQASPAADARVGKAECTPASTEQKRRRP